ncbi:MAG: Electron transport complex subunit RsxB [Syntrophaceae bacterium PtaU1.Bin231]|nr:MAG: Electron transport complex subunit RsxB [Syntrophaceae bacterium PtaU1.Bin231]HOG18597.1 cytochrome b/b6 domain-containing protein [Syntrophales bacterium]HOI15445.1 cytochrome b/b6 domain-containing protein [Geobacteraceae bacterium]
MGKETQLNALHSQRLLDEAWSPVARFRLLSLGVNENTRLLEASQAVGDSGCLACGNCIDNCPVVKANVGLVFEQNQRTSMNLENVVQEECRRCYRCVKSCPQVSKSLKEYAAGFRRAEKIVHLLAAFTIVSLAATGVTHSHYVDVLPGLEADTLKYAHRTIGVLSIVIPFLYYKLDIGHFRRTIRKVFTWGASDVQWLKDTWAHIFKPGSGKALARNEFNPGQKVWYTFIISFFPILYLSGLTAMVMGSGAGESTRLVDLKVFHMMFALPFDIMLFIHIYIKYIREWIRDGFKILRNYRETKSFVFTRN